MTRVALQEVLRGGGAGVALRALAARQAPGSAAAAAWAAAGGRALLQDSSEPATDIGTGSPDQTIPSTAAVVAGVVGGLSTLTLCLAVALMFAVASIYGFQICRGRRGGSRSRGSSAAASPQGSKKSDMDVVLEMGRARPLPSIVTTHMAPATAQGHEASDDSTNLVSSRSTSRDQVTPLRSDVSWKDCLIEPAQIQILRRRDGKPWVLGGGAFGQVYKALYDGVQVVAAKVLTGLADERVFQSFVREAAILRDMRDRNIVQFVGICMGSEEEGQPDEAMMIQEFMEAGDLVNIFKALKWRDEAGRRVFGWYARGKRAACDVARVLLARDGACKLADVGLARSLLTKNYLTHAGTLGTFAWSAPEVLTGQQCTFSADIYSFGIVLWEIFTGEIPNRGSMRNPRVPEECPQAAVDLMDCCLSLNPSERPTAKQIVQLMESMPAETPGEAEKRGATLRAASLAEWRDQLPQQVSKFMPGSPSAQAEVGTSTWRTELTNDAEELEAAAERAEHGPPPAPPQATLRLEDMPPLSDADRIF
ncbi:hypothetical protein CHLNCDRAFT_138200 [Chlorella variabilis]|uniref:Protein kinase domain-containing protein n=1 Tax=Chlorella variabilis TaxID=554065 RepID=E1Z3S8_CHLVA|nr:hypothetical protein CHLNCDRAFT_138200 [Chlorella variabilis]EFN59227.1 hypothetical protein CHLNCDRAFT_138200 [Chlorella variabilis]|eukprot:XP_005851329.1 hypothetical protein CHLNCDRAFT_138200 [Chlorella variabilis]